MSTGTAGRFGEQSRAHILVLSFSDLADDPRVNRQLRFLSPHYRITAAGWTDPGLNGVEFIPVRTERRSLVRRIVFGIPRRARAGLDLLSRRFQSHYWKRPEVRHCLEKLRAHGLVYDLVIANDIDCLPIALATAGPAPVLYDAHEFAPGQHEDQISFRLFRQRYNLWLCRTFMPATRAVTTVSQSIADAYAGLAAVRPTVIWNAPDREDLAPSPGGEKIRLVHHGLAERCRKVEQMIGMMRWLDDRFELNLVLVGDDQRYLQQLNRQARRDFRIRLLPRVPMRHLSRFLNQFDVGVYLLPDSSRQLRWALPNKFFEFIQGRLGLAISPTPEMARLVREHDLGVIAEDFRPQSLARQLMALDPARISYFKQRSDAAALLLSAAPQREKLLALVASLLAPTLGGDSPSHRGAESSPGPQDSRR